MEIFCDVRAKVALLLATASLVAFYAALLLVNAVQ